MSMYERLFRSVLYPAYESVLRGRKTLRYLQEYERQQWLSPEELRALQTSKLRSLLEHCQTQVPYWRRRFKELGFAWQDLRQPEDLAALPPIGKDEIRAHYDEMIADNWRGRTWRKATGGSTGQPFAFEYTRESYERRMAVMLRGYGWAGASFGVRRLDVWGGDLGLASRSQRFKAELFDRVLLRRVLSAFDMRRDNLVEYAQAIDAWRPRVIVGYTSALETLADWILDGNPLGWHPDSVITAAEMLSDRQRAALELAFGAPVFHTYGCREFMLIGAECEHHLGYHASEDHLVVEIADETGKPLVADVGNVLITDLHNWGMPFLRYANGDLARASAGVERCPCGRGLKRFGPVEGRRLDVLRTPDGRIIPGEFFPHLLKEVAAVDRFQVRQRQLDCLELLIVAKGEFTAADEVFLRDKVSGVVGNATRLDILLVEDIPLTPSGKRRVTVSELPTVAL